MKSIPHRAPLIVKDTTAIGCHDQRLLRWAHRVGRLPTGVGAHDVDDREVPPA